MSVQLQEFERIAINDGLQLVLRHARQLGAGHDIVDLAQRFKVSAAVVTG